MPDIKELKIGSILKKYSPSKNEHIHIAVICKYDYSIMGCVLYNSNPSFDSYFIRPGHAFTIDYYYLKSCKDITKQFYADNEL